MKVKYPDPIKPIGKRNNEYFEIFLNHPLSVCCIDNMVSREESGNVSKTAGITVIQYCLNTKHAITPNPNISNPINEEIRILL